MKTQTNADLIQAAIGKTPFDPNVSDPDIATAQQGVKWFLREYHELMHRCSEAVTKMT
jgi:hypothetical protein